MKTYEQGIIGTLLEVKQRIFDGMSKTQLIHWINGVLEQIKNDKKGEEGNKAK